MFQQNTSFSTQFRVNRPKLCGNWAFPQNFRTTKSEEIWVYYAVHVLQLSKWKKWAPSQQVENSEKMFNFWSLTWNNERLDFQLDKKSHPPGSSLSFTGHNKPSKPQLGISGGGNCGQSSLVWGPVKICDLSWNVFLSFGWKIPKGTQSKC